MALALVALEGVRSGEGATSEATVQTVRAFESIYEPSGVQQLPDGRVLVIEDEKLQSISALTVERDGALSAEPLRRGSLLDDMLGKPALGKVEDLEGVGIDGKGYVYAVTSHSPTRKGRIGDARQKLVRFKVDGNRIVEPLAIKKLKEEIIKKHEVLNEFAGILSAKDESRFNIEGLSFDERKEKLLIGLRSPVIDENAIIAIMENPIAAFERDEKPVISDQLVSLDLDKGGIRALVFDTRLGGYLILSRREDKKNKPFKLWFWDGDVENAPRRTRVAGLEDLSYAEGIAPIRVDGRERILIVFDDGDTARRKGGHYVLLTYDRLEIDE